ncbi:uncharacterized protein [Temnothorax longispinosus]|uniref:uncharacterized protein n=1 Tax=Temnothorax longispinosus TaxID=300112 RepID=UPI003A99B668
MFIIICRRQLLKKQCKEANGTEGTKKSTNVRKSVESLVTSDTMDEELCTQQTCPAVTPKCTGTYDNVQYREDDDIDNYSLVEGTKEPTNVRKSVESLVTPGTMDVKLRTQQTYLAVTPKCTDTYDNVQYCENNDIEHYILVEGAKEPTYVRKSVESLVTPGTMDVELRTQQTCPAVTPECTDYAQHWTLPEDDDIENSTLVIEKGGTDTGRIAEHEPVGRRIIDPAFYLKELHRTFDNHKYKTTFQCSFEDWTCVKSRRLGLLTQFFFKCQMCNSEDNFWSEPVKSDEILDTNRAAVAGTITVGIGYAQLEELCAAMNISCMAEHTYIKYREELVDSFLETAMESMKMAAEEEKQLAIEKNETINGIPYITVVADGSWMKRSYGKAYDSLSGAGAIIGHRTRKILFVGIRNKYCTVCDVAERSHCEAKTHKCYKNFDRNASSTSMESDAIAEGFNSSLEVHGLIYRTLIADGDSNVYHCILKNDPYREMKVRVIKIECTNHLLRNLSNKLKNVAETTQPKGQKRKPNFVQLRNVIKSNILPMRKEVMELASSRRGENIPPHLQATKLRDDIYNMSPNHVFGEHTECKKRGRKCEDATKTNYVDDLKKHGLYQKIQIALRYIAAHSESLLLNYTNNPAESFNSIICKEIGGKRVNFGKRGSYNARVLGSAVQYNTQDILTRVHKVKGKAVPPVVEKLEQRRQIKVARTRESRQIDGRQKRSKRESGTDRYYGPQSQKPDVTDDVFEKNRQQHFKMLAENAKNRKQIERNTIDQRDSELWLFTRSLMLTASNFGKVCRMRLETPRASTVKDILFPPCTDTAAMKYGRDREEDARKELAAKLKKQIKPCGLFIDGENPFLGASPDGLIDEDGLVEIKCPKSAENLTAEEAIETSASLRNIFDKNNRDNMNKNHRFFYQVQGQLNITQREYCIFAVWTPKSMKIVRVNRDNAFWETNMLPLLKRFYHDSMLPEILDSRHKRNMSIREPRYIIESQKASKKLSSRKTIEQNAVKSENVINENNETLKCDILPMKTAITTAMIAQDMEQDDDCTYIGTSYKRDITEEDKARRIINLDKVIIPISIVKENVLSGNELTDESIDEFLRIVRQNTPFETQSVQYQGLPDYIDASKSDLSLQIIGGKNQYFAEGIQHWRCIFFEGTKLFVYDSIPGCTYDRLVLKEREYIKRRYPKIRQSDIIFEKVDAQPDGTSCGIYAAAFATTVALGGNPCDEKYSKNVKCMRQHFIKIIEEEDLSLFPTRS